MNAIEKIPLSYSSLILHPVDKDRAAARWLAGKLWNFYRSAAYDGFVAHETSGTDETTGPDRVFVTREQARRILRHDRFAFMDMDHANVVEIAMTMMEEEPVGKHNRTVYADWIRLEKLL